ncbi:inter-alpha-trypsin inhibitor heavy chain H3-like [Amphiura filiformis]|uniref:inter-alpha-trypsin inhibitor heavy chain H3-like n=1 Tax=Amphiura filiformis TaxID=82378 RepID=UPI003B219AAD
MKFSKLSCLLIVYIFSLLRFANGAAFVALEDDLLQDDIDNFLQRARRNAIFGSGDEENGSSDNENSVISTIPDKPQVLKFHVQSRITGRYASTVITSKLHNWKNASAEAEFPLTLPEEAFISDFFMIVGGTIYRSEVKEKKEAQKKYDKAKKKGQTAGQVKQKNPKASEFGISVNVAANSSVTFNLTYQQLLSRKNGVIQQKISSVPGQILDNYKVDIYLTETQGITLLDAGWLNKGSSHLTANLSRSDMTIVTQSHFRARIVFQPSRALQRLAGGDSGFNKDLVVQYDVNHDLSAGNLQVMNGYFVHYFSPEGLPPVRKSVVFTIDVSGSMSGAGKLEYTKEALLVILDDMREGDTFNIVTFESNVRVWRDTMLDVSPDNVQEAKDFVGQLEPLFSTDLHGGIIKGVEILRKQMEFNFANGYSNDVYPMIIMLTDGQPSMGITEPNEIRSNVREEIRREMSLFTLGFGNDVDSTLLEQLALENQGAFRKIYVDGSAGLQLKGFYDEVATPLLYNIDIQYTDNAIDINSVTQTNFISYFKGTELVVAGKLSNEIDVLSASVLASSRLDNELEMTVSTNTQDTSNVLSNRHAVDDFAQQLWAYKTIKLLLDQMKIATVEAEKAALRDRALDLSLKYRFVTPLTSLVVVKPEEDETKPGPDDAVSETSKEASPTVDPSHTGGVPRKVSKGRGSNRQGAGRGGATGSRGGGYADSDPHFLIHIPANDLSICFDISGNHGDVFNLLTDENLGIKVHGSIISTGKSSPGHKHSRTYFGSMTIYIKSHTILLTPSHITIDKDLILPWDNHISVSLASYGVTELQSYIVSVTERRRVEVHNDDGGVVLVFVLHKVKEDHEYKVDHLGFYVDQGEGLSPDVHGLIGQFQYKSIPVVPGSIQISKDHVVTAELRVINKHVKVLKRKRHNSLTKIHQPCWFTNSNGKGLIAGHYTDYLIR